MANVIQIPSPLSLSGNLQDVIISTSMEISFVLKKGATILLNEQYLPINGIVNIDISGVVTSALSINIPDADIYTQSGGCGKFTILVDNAKVGEFTAILAGVEKFSDTATNFLTANFLTWQNQEKQVTYNQPEWLSYYFCQNASVFVQFYYTDGTSEKVSIGNGYTGDGLLSFNVQFARIWPLGELGDKIRNGFFDIWVEAPAGVQLSYIQRYILKADTTYDEIYLCANSLGGVDTFLFSGEKKFIPDIESKISSYNAELEASTPGTARKYSQNTGVLGKSAASWVWEMFRSSQNYYLQNGNITPIVIDNSTIQSSSIENINSFDFEYRLSQDTGFLNIVRSNNLPSNIEITSPDSALFFLAPRLVDFPLAALADELLFAVQSPYVNQWNKLSWGGMKAYFQSLIASYASSQPDNSVEIIGTLSEVAPSERNVFSSLRSLATFFKLSNILKSTDKDIGLSDRHVLSHKRSFAYFLRKDKDDTASGFITFKKGFQIGYEFVSSLLGKGARFSPDANGQVIGEMYGLKLHGFLEVPELSFNRIDVISGEMWNSISFGTIEKVDTTTKEVWIKLVDGEKLTSKVDDILRGIFHHFDTDNNTDTIEDDCGFSQMPGFSTSYFTPIEIYADGKGFKYELRVGTTIHPQPGMKFACYGNFSDIRRQASAYKTREYTRYLAGVNTWTIVPEKHIVSQFGKIEGLAIGGKRMRGYGSYQKNVYFDGALIQFSPDQENIKGDDAYCVSLSSEVVPCKINADGTVTLTDTVLDVTANNKNVVTNRTNVVANSKQVTVTRPALSTNIRAFKGIQELFYSTRVVEKGYTVDYRAIGCTANISSGILTIGSVIDTTNCYVDIDVNCEGNIVFSKKFSLVPVQDGTNGLNGNDAAILRGPTLWVSGATYLAGVGDEKFIDIVLYDKLHYYCATSHQATQTNRPSASDNWKLGNNLDFVATKLLFAERAIIDNAIIRLLATSEEGARVEILEDDIKMRDAEGAVKLHVHGGTLSERGTVSEFSTLEVKNTRTSTDPSNPVNSAHFFALGDSFEVKVKSEIVIPKFSVIFENESKSYNTSWIYELFLTGGELGYTPLIKLTTPEYIGGRLTLHQKIIYKHLIPGQYYQLYVKITTKMGATIFITDDPTGSASCYHPSLHGIKIAAYNAAFEIASDGMKIQGGIDSFVRVDYSGSGGIDLEMKEGGKSIILNRSGLKIDRNDGLGFRDL